MTTRWAARPTSSPLPVIRGSRRTPTCSRATTSTRTTSTPTCAQCPAGQQPGPNGPNQGCSDVTPTVPVPVGTGMWIAGGNANVVRNNRFYDNWRRGAMLFAVADVFVCNDPNNQVAGCDPASTVPATSYRNRFFDNQMGRAPNGSAQPNGLDFWWDQGGLILNPASIPANSGNCWYGNTGPDGTPGSVTGLPSPSGPPGDNLPSDCNNSPLPGGQHGQVAELLTCSTVPRETRAARGSRLRQSPSEPSMSSPRRAAAATMLAATPRARSRAAAAAPQPSPRSTSGRTSGSRSASPTATTGTRRTPSSVSERSTSSRTSRAVRS